MHIHFVGINGSGISGAACIAAENGYKVSGCDFKKDSNYSKQFEKVGIVPIIGHDESHITDDVDLVVITPHFLYKDLYKSIPELVSAKEKGILIKWQEFIGKHIMQEKNTVAVCGTHGKTTTTSLVGLTLENAGIDPTVLVGGIVPEWDRTFRTGNSDYYVIEADEYDNNFIHYHPKYIVFHTLEMEHPEIFKSFDEYREVFVNFLKTIQKDGYLIFNMDSKNICDTVDILRDFLKSKNVTLIGYGIDNHNFDCDKKYFATDINLRNGANFKIDNETITTSLIGKHNVYNLLASYCVCKEITEGKLNFQQAISDFSGAKRRLEVVLDNEKVILYNDYAHHHNQVHSNLEALRDTYQDTKIIAILEPHQISRLVDNSTAYIESLDIADKFYISKIFKGREKDKEIPDVDAMIASYKDKGCYNPDNESLIKDVMTEINSYDGKTIVLVMGAGESYKITESLQNQLK